MQVGFVVSGLGVVFNLGLNKITLWQISDRVWWQMQWIYETFKPNYVMSAMVHGSFNSCSARYELELGWELNFVCTQILM